MIKRSNIFPIEMTFEEFLEKYSEEKYMYCEMLDGRWWYKDMETGEDLPMYCQPIYNEQEMRKKYKNFIEQGIIRESDK